VCGGALSKSVNRSICSLVALCLCRSFLRPCSFSEPDNVLLDANGDVRLSDFGLSVELSAKHGYKIRGNAGTSGYLSPEVCTGEPYGLSADVWTYGQHTHMHNTAAASKRRQQTTAVIQGGRLILFRVSIHLFS